MGATFTDLPELGYFGGWPVFWGIESAGSAEARTSAIGSGNQGRISLDRCRVAR